MQGVHQGAAAVGVGGSRRQWAGRRPDGRPSGLLRSPRPSPAAPITSTLPNGITSISMKRPRVAACRRGGRGSLRDARRRVSASDQSDGSRPADGLSQRWLEVLGPPPDALLRASASRGGKLQPLQEPVVLDSAGRVRNSASVDKVPENWLQLLQEAGRECQSLLDDDLAAVFVRGSVPQGAAVDGLSDLDLIVYFWLPDGVPQPSRTVRAVRQAFRGSADQLKSRHPFCTKVEFKCYGLSRDGPWGGAVLRGERLSKTASLGLPGAFDLAAGAALVDGTDLAALLPPDAAIPRPVVLPYLAQDITAAREAAQHAAAEGDVAAGVRASCWALKRALRAAYEAVHASKGCPLYTRDLYWCCYISGAHDPKLATILTRALETYVSLRKLPSTPGRVATSASSDVLEAMLLAETVAEAVLRSFWASVLEPGPGEITRKIHRLPLSAWLPTPSSSEPAAEPWQRSAADVWGVAREAVMSAALSFMDFNSSFSVEKYCSQAAGVKKVKTVDCSSTITANSSSHPLDGINLCEPVVLRSAASSWPCVKTWSLRYLAAQKGFRGKVRVAPSLEFPFCEPALLQELVALLGKEAAPSLVVDMSATEFAFRTVSSVLPPVAYTSGEHYYMQAELSEALLRDMDFQSPWLLRLRDLLHGAGSTSAGSSPLGHHSRTPWAQEPRAWISCAGSVSPTHFDNSPSLLIQVGGHKQMLFLAPQSLAELNPFPEGHLLRRRCRVQHPPERQPVWEAILAPGDVVFFPPQWAHFTKTLDQSISITARFSSMLAARRGQS